MRRLIVVGAVLVMLGLGGGCSKTSVASPVATTGVSPSVTPSTSGGTTSPTTKPTVTASTVAPTPASYVGIVSALMSSPIGVCDKTAGGVVDPLTSVKLFVVCSGPPTGLTQYGPFVEVSSWASHDQAYTAALLGFPEPSEAVDAWYVGSVSVLSYGLTASQTSTLGSVMESAGATHYTG